MPLLRLGCSAKAALAAEMHQAHPVAPCESLASALFCYCWPLQKAHNDAASSQFSTESANAWLGKGISVLAPPCGNWLARLGAGCSSTMLAV